MAFKRDRIKPTPYPFLAFHLLRSSQLLSSLIVAIITFYFMRELHRNNYSLPWTFILLLTVSLLTLASLSVTITLHIRHGLNPLLNLCLNTLLALLWTLSFSLLAWWSSSAITHACAVENWDTSIGVGVCRAYKALFSFALLGLLGTLGALGLDVSVLRAGTARGRFVSLGVVRGGTGELDVDEGIWDANPHPGAMSGAGGAEGYAVPEGQFGYADMDTGYAGAAGQVGRRSVEERL